jgi:hypothetical protein
VKTRRSKAISGTRLKNGKERVLKATLLPIFQAPPNIPPYFSAISTICSKFRHLLTIACNRAKQPAPSSNALKFQCLTGHPGLPRAASAELARLLLVGHRYIISP